MIQQVAASHDTSGRVAVPRTQEVAAGNVRKAQHTAQQLRLGTFSRPRAPKDQNQLSLSSGVHGIHLRTLRGSNLVRQTLCARRDLERG